MPRNITVTLSDGTIHTYQNVPDDITPEKVTARAEAEFHSDVVALDGGRAGGKSTPSATPSGSWTPNVKVVKDGRGIAQSIYPGIRITENDRDPNSALGRANPGSWHNHTKAALDVDANSLPKGMTFEQYLDGYRKAGYSIVQSINEDETRGGKRSPHATGDHWHVVLGPKADGTEETVEIPNPEPSPPPEAPAAALATPALVAPPPAEEEGGIVNFLKSQMPASLSEVGEGLMQGVTPIVQGALDLPAMVANPINTLLQKAGVNIGNDLAGDTAEQVGLPENDSLSGSLIRGASGGLTGSLEATALAKLGKGAVSQGLATLGSTPVRDAASGVGANLASNLAGQAGLGPVGQMAAGVAGGVGGFKATELPKALTKDAYRARAAAKIAKTNPFASTDAEFLEDLRRTQASMSSPTDPKGRASVTVKEINSVENSYTTGVREALNKLDLPADVNMRLKRALSNKHSIPDEDIEALRGSVAGDAVADAIIKTRRVRKLTPEVPMGKGLSRGLIDVAAAVSDLASITGVGTYGAASTGLNIARKLAKGGGAEAARVHSADRLLAKEDIYKKLPELVGSSGQRESQQALFDAADAATAGKQTAAAERQASLVASANQKELARTARLKLLSDNKRLQANNDLDNIVGDGGFRRSVYDRTGLLPDQQDASVLNAVWKGKVSPEQQAAFLADPEKLMKGNGGNAIIDRLNSMADKGAATRDPDWSPPQPQAPPPPLEAPHPNANVDAQGEPIRSLPAYKGGIQKNIAREMMLRKELDEIDPVVITLGDGTSTRASGMPRDVYAMDPAALLRAEAIKAELAGMKPTPKP